MSNKPLVKLPRTVKKGEIFIIKAKMKHAMETGWRETQKGEKVPRKRLNKFLCTFNGKDVFRADLHSGISADPYLMFPVKLTESGVFQFVWVEDGGAEYDTQAELQVT